MIYIFVWSVFVFHRKHRQIKITKFKPSMSLHVFSCSNNCDTSCEFVFRLRVKIRFFSPDNCHCRSEHFGSYFIPQLFVFHATHVKQCAIWHCSRIRFACVSVLFSHPATDKNLFAWLRENSTQRKFHHKKKRYERNTLVANIHFRFISLEINFSRTGVSGGIAIGPLYNNLISTYNTLISIHYATLEIGSHRQLAKSNEPQMNQYFYLCSQSHLAKLAMKWKASIWFMRI